MTSSGFIGYQPLVEKIVRNEDIFCSLLFDYTNRTLRVVDFRGGNFQSKHAFLEGVLIKEGMRKIFTLIERDDMTGWQRVGYHREGSIPGYYKRSDAYIMSRIYDADFDAKYQQGEDLSDSKGALTDIKAVGKKLTESKDPNIKVDPISEMEVIQIIDEESARRETKPAKGAAKAKKISIKPKKAGTAELLEEEPQLDGLIFPQFSREVDYFHFLIQNKRTKQTNVLSTEYQDCFGNAKVHFCLPIDSKADQNLAKIGLQQAIDQMLDMGAVSIFATVPAGDAKANEVYAGTGFRNSGWMSRQLLMPEGPLDVILWTRKLV
jgi:hypothetical protein